MKHKSRICAVILGILLLLAPASLFAKSVDLGVPILKLSDVKRGMKGHGLSVFQGRTPKKFSFEVIGVIPNRFPKQSIIVVRMSGQNLEHSGTIAGMSGSPLYVDGRLMGAVSYAWGFAKDPIAGVTPIESMIEDLERDPRDIGQLVRARQVRAVWGAYAEDQDFAAALARWSALYSPQTTKGFAPISLPISLPPMPPAWTAAFEQGFNRDGLVTVSSASSSGIDTQRDDPPVGPRNGGVLGVAFMLGDFDMTGVGTITHVLKDRLIGFGHPFLQAGATDFPMLDSSIVTVLPNQKVSFKMAASGPKMGQLVGDFQASVVGKMNGTSRMIPIEVRIRSNGLKVDDVYRMSGTSMPVAVPMVLATAVGASLQHSIPHVLPYHYRVTTSWKTKQGFRGSEVGFAVADDPKNAIIGVVLSPVISLATNPFGLIEFTEFEVDVEVIPDRMVAGITRLSLPTEEVVAGDTVSLNVHMKPFAKAEEIVEVMDVEIPKELAGQKIEVLVGASSRLLKPRLPKPVDLASFIEYMKPIGSPHELAVVINGARVDVDKDGVLYKSPPTALIGGMMDPQLKPRPSPVFRQFVTRKESPYLVAGQGNLRLTILPRVP